MLIVLEGCDGTGKTTLARLMQKYFNMEYIHCTAETKNDYEFFESIINRSAEKDIICDRFFWGQFVYQSENERYITRDELFLLYDLMKKLDDRNKIILVEADLEKVCSRLDERHESIEASDIGININRVKVSLVMHRFRILAQESCKSIPVYKYNTSTGYNTRLGRDVKECMH